MPGSCGGGGGVPVQLLRETYRGRGTPKREWCRFLTGNQVVKFGLLNGFALDTFATAASASPKAYAREQL